MRFFLPFIVFLSLIIFLWQGLALSPDEEAPAAIVNRSSPSFSLPSLMNDNQTITQEVFKGNITVLNIWASWCPSCRIEHPFWVRLSKKNSSEGLNDPATNTSKDSKKYVLLGLNARDDMEAGRGWLEKHGNPYQDVIFDQDGSLVMDYGIYGIPDTLVIDKQGMVRYRHQGEMNEDIWNTTILPVIDKIALENLNGK